MSEEPDLVRLLHRADWTRPSWSLRSWEISAGPAGELIDQHGQARLLVVRAEPAGTGEGGDAVQRAPGNLGQGVRVTAAGQWRYSFPKLGEGGLQLAGRLGPAEGQLGIEGEHGVVEGRMLQGEADIGPGEFS